MGKTADIMLSESEVAQFLGISIRTLQGWRLSGRGPKFVKISRLVRYKRSDRKRPPNPTLRALQPA